MSLSPIPRHYEARSIAVVSRHGEESAETIHSRHCEVCPKQSALSSLRGMPEAIQRIKLDCFVASLLAMTIILSYGSISCYFTDLSFVIPRDPEILRFPHP